MSKKIRVGIIFGGRSAEHEVSLLSAKSIIAAIDKKKYDVVPIGIDKNGTWHLQQGAQLLLNSENPKLIALNKAEQKPVTLVVDKTATQLMSLENGKSLGKIDVVFPVLHGTYGEDGTMQGLLKLANIPFVGPSVLGSAVSMDKDVAKILLLGFGIPVAKFLRAVSWMYVKEKAFHFSFRDAKKHLGIPFFVKPANAGSSVGVHKVHTEKEYMRAMKDAFRYDTKVLIEEYIAGREIECSVLGNEHPIASIPGEVIPAKKHGFYSYEAKYIDEHGAQLEIPAQLPKKIIAEAQRLAIVAFKVLQCEGMARVDMFLTKQGKIYINEINTIPGFTKISMYPKLWEASGIPYPKLIDMLIQLAIKRHKRDAKLKTSFTA